MVALFDAFEYMHEPRPAFLDEMIDKRSLEIFPKLKKAAYKEFRKHKKEVFGITDQDEIIKRLDHLVQGEFRKLTEEEKDILYCSLDYHEMKDGNWAWYEWNIVSELLSEKQVNQQV